MRPALGARLRAWTRPRKLPRPGPWCGLRPRPAYARSRETSVYLADGARGRGLGRRLYDDLLARLERDGVHRALALVALPNDASVALHRAAGFREVGTMTQVGRKFGRWIDTTWFERRLGDDPAG